MGLVLFLSISMAGGALTLGIFFGKMAWQMTKDPTQMEDRPILRVAVLTLLWCAAAVFGAAVVGCACLAVSIIGFF